MTPPSDSARQNAPIDPLTVLAAIDAPPSPCGVRTSEHDVTHSLRPRWMNRRHRTKTDISIVEGHTDAARGIHLWRAGLRAMIALVLASATVGPAMAERLVWHSLGAGGAMAYGEPETDALASARCRPRAIVEFTVSDETGRARQSGSRTATVAALNSTEEVAFRIEDGDGDQIVFEARPTSLALVSLLIDRPFSVSIPGAGRFTVVGEGASRLAKRLVTNCLAAR